MAARPPVQADEAFLQRIFQQVDKDRSNAINATELQACLSNGTWEPFNAETIKLMITMFDKNHKGQLNYEEFKQLWKYIEDWRQCFLSFDKDKSGYINKEELKLALTTFGYQLTDTFYDLLLTKFVKGGQGKCASINQLQDKLATLHKPYTP
jgi:Ca2+-binding EF-hand superfamily protein